MCDIPSQLQVSRRLSTHNAGVRACVAAPLPLSRLLLPHLSLRTGRPAGGPILAGAPTGRGPGGGAFILAGPCGVEDPGRERVGEPPPPPSCRPPLSPLHPQIRFQRFGRKKAPFYRLVAIDSRDRREGRPLEVSNGRGDDEKGAFQARTAPCFLFFPTSHHPSIHSSPRHLSLRLSSLLSFHSAWATTTPCARRPT